MEKNKNSDKIQKEMEKARKLIQQKKFDDARAILITIDDPKATEWLNRINEMSPSQPQTVILQEKKKGGCLRNTLSAIGAIFVCAIFFALVNPNPNATPRNSNGSGTGSSSGQANTTASGGSRTSPYEAGSIQEIRDGRFRVNSIDEDATAAVHRMNMFNAEPDSGQDWVLVNVTFFCDLDPEDVCTVTLMQFELVGSAGKAYDKEFAVLDNDFTGEVFGGGQITGNLGFIVDNSDSNLLLIVNDMGRRAFFAIPTN